MAGFGPEGAIKHVSWIQIKGLRIDYSGGSVNCSTLSDNACGKMTTTHRQI